MVPITPDNRFDSAAHTQGGMLHLMQYLWDRFRDSIQTQIDEAAASGATIKYVDVDSAVRRAPATAFLRFATDYLHEHRVIENFYLDANHGIKLSNNDLVAICPGTDIQGTMQDSGAIGITEGRSQPGNEGVSASNSLKI